MLVVQGQFIYKSQHVIGIIAHQQKSLENRYMSWKPTGAILSFLLSVSKGRDPLMQNAFNRTFLTINQKLPTRRQFSSQVVQKSDYATGHFRLKWTLEIILWPNQWRHVKNLAVKYCPLFFLIHKNKFSLSHQCIDYSLELESIILCAKPYSASDWMIPTLWAFDWLSKSSINGKNETWIKWFLFEFLMNTFFLRYLGT